MISRKLSDDRKFLGDTLAFGDGSGAGGGRV